MARELIADSDLRFEGFASYPNSAAFEPNSFLENASNVRIIDGAIEPRKGSVLCATTSAGSSYVVASHGKTGDHIKVFGSNQEYLIDSGTIISNPLISGYQPVRGQGYAASLCSETLDTDYVAGGNITERLVTAKNDQLRFTIYGGVRPNPPDTLSLVQCTYDNIKALVTAHNSILAFGSRSIYAIKAGIGYMASPKKTDSMHQVQKISSFDGVTGPDAVASSGGITVFFDNNRIPGIKIMSGDKFSEGAEPMSTSIQDIIDKTDKEKLDKVCVVAYCGRFYVTLPFTTGLVTSWKVLVLNPAIKGVFESLDTYPFDPSVLVVARKASVMKLFAFDANTGKIYMLEEGAFDSGATNSEPIPYEITTRNYMFRTMSDKKYESFSVHLDNATGSAVQIRAITINPDSEQVIDKFTGAIGTTVRRGLINKRSMGVKLKVVVSSGRARILGLGLDASIAGRSLFSIY